MANSHSLKNSPHPTRPPSQSSQSHPTYASSCTAATPPWAGGSPSTGNPHIKRSYSQIIAEANATIRSSTLIQFKLSKITDSEGKKPPNLSFSEFGEFLFDVLKIEPDSCLEIDLSTGRYDTRELLVKEDADTSMITTTNSPFVFKGHEISATVLSNQVTKVTFKHVPLSVPDEEIIHLCCHYGELVDGVVHRDTVTIGGASRHTITSSTRWVEVKLSPGKTFHNFYWLGGPLPGDVGRRVTVLHPNQPRQCSWCFKYPPSSSSTTLTPSHCRGGGDGKTCQTRKTPRAKMSAYIETLKGEGYISLRDQYLAPHAAFPSLQSGKSNLVDVLAKVDDVDHQPDEDEDEDGNRIASDALVNVSVDHEKSSSSASTVSEEVLKPPQKPPEKSPAAPGKSPDQGGKHQWKLETNFERYISGNLKVIKEGDIETYANYCLEQQLVMLDPEGDPQKAALAPGAESEFLKFSKKTASGFKTREGKLKTVSNMVWSQLQDPLLQAQFKVKNIGEGRGGKKGRLFSESSPGGNPDSRSKSLRIESPIKP